MSNRRSFIWVFSSCVALVTLQIVWSSLRLGGERTTEAFADLVRIAAALAATAACVRAAGSHRGRSRVGWLALGAATASWGLGAAAWAYHELALGRDVPFPSTADVGFAGFVPLAIVAMLSFGATPRGTAQRTRALLDGVIIAGSVSFIGWATILGPAYREKSPAPLASFLTLAYPIGDLVIVAIVLSVITKARPRERLPLSLIGAGLGTIAVADAGFTYLVLNDGYHSGSLIDALWTAGLLLIALGALTRVPISVPSVQDERRVGPTSILTPYAPFLAATGVAMAVEVSRGSLEPFLFWNAVAVVLTVAVRQVIALFDNLSLNRTLERRVLERTADLELALAQLGQSHRLQDQFVSNASHEFRTPMSLILGSTHMLSAEKALSPRGSTAVAILRRATVHLRRLVDDLLLASGLADQVTCERSPFDAGKAVREAVETFSEAPRPVRPRVAYPLAGIGDADRFGHVIRHLVSNALKHAPEGTEVVVESYARNGHVHVVVSDEGPGVPPHLREEIFRPFYQIDGSATRKHGGMGLGLYLALKLTEAMGGRLSLDETEHGATFRVEIDAAPSAARPSLGAARFA